MLQFDKVPRQIYYIYMYPLDEQNWKSGFIVLDWLVLHYVNLIVSCSNVRGLLRKC